MKQLDEIIRGLKLLVRSLLLISRSPTIRKQISRIAILLFLFNSSISLLSHLILVPFIVTSHLCNLFLGSGLCTQISLVGIYLKDAGMNLNHIVPQFVLLAIRHLYPEALDRLFFEGLNMSRFDQGALVSGPRHDGDNQSNDDINKTIRESSRQPRIPRLTNFLKRYAKQILYFLVIQLLSFIPVIGTMLYVYMTYRYIHNLLGEKLTIASLVLYVISPPFRTSLRSTVLPSISLYRFYGRIYLKYKI